MNYEFCDVIHIEGLKVFAHHGVFPQEKEAGQDFYVNADLYTDLREAGLTDDLTKSTHYGEVSLLIGRCLTEQTYDLIETAAERTAEEILRQFPRVRAVTLELHKPHAPIPMEFSTVCVRIHRGWHRAYVALGSNMGDSRAYIEEALRAFSADPRIRVEKVSSLIVTKPYGGVEQDDFLNGVVLLDTLYSPAELLYKLHEIEAAAHRERTLRWGPRTLDLDILFYDKLIYEDDNLIIPHVDLHNRDFVLQPMAEIAPCFRHPILQKTMQQLWEELRAREEKGGQTGEEEKRKI